MTLPQAAGSRGWRLAILALLALAGASFAAREAATAAAAPDANLPASGAPDALRRQPLDAAALRVLAFAPQTDAARAKTLLRLSAAVSRRDRQTQLLLLNDRAQAGDVAGTLGHYDALLSTTPAVSGPLYGVLMRALGEPRIRAGLAAYVGRDWFRPFLRAAAGPGGDPRQALALARDVGALSDPDWRNEVAGPLITGLVAGGALAEAQAIADGLGLGDWRGLGFSPATMDSRLGSLAWRLEGQGGAAANLYSAGILAVTAEPQRRGRVAQRLTTWPPGRYRLAYVVEISGAPAADVTWRVACKDGQPGGLVIAAQPAARGGGRSALVALGQGCPVQEWELWVEGADSQTASAAYVSRVAVEAL